MARSMRKLARWHIWLGWLAGVPLVLWCVSSFVMVLKPIEEVRGQDLRRDLEAEVLPTGGLVPIPPPPGATEARTVVQDGRAVTVFSLAAGHVVRFDSRSGAALPAFTEAEARRLVARAIVGGDKVESVRLFDADHPPLDFRKPVAAWRVALADGTHVYVGQESGAIEAVRTRWWRFYDFMWGIHIMDLQTREDQNRPLMLLFAGLALVSSLFGIALLFRRRRARPSPR